MYTISGNIRVFCRCRPLNKEEILAANATVVDFDVAKNGDLGILTSSSAKKIFKFDRVYTPKDDQGINLLQSIIDDVSIRSSRILHLPRVLVLP